MFGPNFILMLLMFGGEGGYKYDVDIIYKLWFLGMYIECAHSNLLF